MEPSNWTYDHDKQASIVPSEHPDLIEALGRLWESEVGDNCRMIALAAGVDAALQMAMGAAICFVLANEDYERWATKTPSGLVVVGEGQESQIRALAETMDKMKGARG